MATPVLESILSNLRTALTAITTTNGYHQTVKQVVRLGLPPWTAKEFPYITVVGVDGTKENSHTKITTDHIDVTLGLFLKNDRADPETDIVNLVCDVEKAVMVDGSRGSKALWTSVTDHSIALLEENETIVAAKVVVSICYRHAYGDPEAVR